MFTLNRDTAMMAAVAVCVLATIYVFREFSKTKNDLYEMKNLVDKHDSFMYSMNDDESDDEAPQQPPQASQEMPPQVSSQMNIMPPPTNPAQ